MWPVTTDNLSRTAQKKSHPLGLPDAKHVTNMNVGAGNARPFGADNNRTCGRPMVAPTYSIELRYKDKRKFILPVLLDHLMCKMVSEIAMA